MTRSFHVKRICRVTPAVVLAAALVLAFAAQGWSRTSLRQPTTPPPPATPPTEAAPSPADRVVPVFDDGCCGELKACCEKPCITYRHRGCKKCGPTYAALLRVKDPCRCCCIEVPICLPECCQGKPCVSSRCGLFGRTITTFTWDCGTCVEVLVTKRGDVRVTYFNA